MYYQTQYFPAQHTTDHQLAEDWLNGQTGPPPSGTYAHHAKVDVLSPRESREFLSGVRKAREGGWL